MFSQLPAHADIKARKSSQKCFFLQDVIGITISPICRYITCPLATGRKT